MKNANLKTERKKEVAMNIGQKKQKTLNEEEKTRN